MGGASLPASIPVLRPQHLTRAKMESPDLDILPISFKVVAITLPGAVCLSYRRRWPNKRGWDIRSQAAAGAVLNISPRLGRRLSAATMKLLLLLGLVALAQCLALR